MSDSRRGSEFEAAVAEIQRLLDPNSTVEHNVFLEDELGIPRQFDVVVRGKIGGRDILGVFECRDHERPVDLPQIDGFIQKRASVRADFGVVVSRSGFTKRALELTKHHRIGAYSLFKESDTEPGFTVLGHYYAKVWYWSELRWRVATVPPESLPIPFDPDATTYLDQNVKDWVTGFLLARSTGSKEGWHRLTVQFLPGTRLSFGGMLVTVSALQVDALRVCQHKRRQVQWTGKARYDWHEGMLTIPPATTLEARTQADLADWDDYDGPIPPPADPSTIADVYMVVEVLPPEYTHALSRDLSDDVDVFFAPFPEGEPVPA